MSSKLTWGCIKELIKLAIYATMSGAPIAVALGLSGSRADLLSQGFIEYKGEWLHSEIGASWSLVSLTEKGSQFLEEVGWANIILRLVDEGELYVMPYCWAKLTLADLPGFLTHDVSSIREKARERMEELGFSNGTNR